MLSNWVFNITGTNGKISSEQTKINRNHQFKYSIQPILFNCIPPLHPPQDADRAAKLFLKSFFTSAKEMHFEAQGRIVFCVIYLQHVAITVPGLETDRWKYYNCIIPESCSTLRFFLFVCMCLELVLTKLQHPKPWTFFLRGFVMYSTKVQISLFWTAEIDQFKYYNCIIPESCSTLWFFLFVFMCLVLVLTKFQHPKT
jgi:hypothetical protein